MTTALRPGLSIQGQEDFSAGSFPGLEVIPPNGAEVIVNGVLADDGAIFGRGGSKYLGTLAATNVKPFRNLWSGNLEALGPVTIASRTQGTTIISEGFQALLPGATDFIQVMTDDTRPQRTTEVGGMVVFVATGSGPGAQVVSWGGYSGAQADGNVTISVNSGERAVTGSEFSSFCSPGKILNSTATIGDRQAVIKSVASDTSLELLNAWQGPSTAGPTTVRSDSYVSSSVVGRASLPLAPPSSNYQTFSSAIFDRLLIARGSRIAFTGDQGPMAMLPDDYHQLPDGAVVLGLEPLQSQMLVFSTGGVYAISGMAYDLTDALGNSQQRLERVAPNLILWDNRGVAGFGNSIVVPCVDDVYLFDAGPRSIGGGIRKLYRSYVRRGFQTGQAAVFDGRYLLPIVSGNDWIDTLVCDLRTGAWTQWDGNGAAAFAFSTKVGDVSHAPQLFSIGAQGSTRRVHDLSTVLDPDDTDTSDADGSQVDLKVTTRTLSVPRGKVAVMWRKFRARLELQGSPTVTLERAEGRPGTSFTTITGPNVSTDDSESIYAWSFGERARAIRFRLTISSASDRAWLRAFDVSFRQSGRP